MIRRLALTAGFAILGAVAFAPSASAQTAPAEEMVEFTGTVDSNCSFSGTTVGTLAAADEGKMLSSKVPGGSSGEIQ